jgi:collagenase-like PrtC family protease
MLQPTVVLAYKIAEEVILLPIKKKVLNLKLTMNLSCRQKIYVPSDFLDKILDAGVSVLKIEGSGRAVDYVYTVTKCYKEAAEAYQNGTLQQR